MNSKVPNKITSTVLNNRFKKKHITPREVDKLNSHCDLIQLLIWWDESSLKFRRNQFTLKDNHRCVVYSGVVYNHYTGQATNPISTLMTYYDLDFPQAVYVATYFLTKVSKLEMENYIQSEYFDKELFASNTDADLNYMLEIDPTQSTLPDIKAAALKRIYAYLCNTRGIDRDIVSHFLKQRYLGLDASNCLCFMTYRGNDVIAITKRGTNPLVSFKQNIVREKHTGFFYGSATVKNYKEVYVFESCIDLMSFLTLVKTGFLPKPEDSACFISLNGASTRYLDKVLIEHPDIEKVHFCLDNDRVGRFSVDSYISDVHNKIPADTWVYYLVTGIPSRQDVKDWNELLQAINAEAKREEDLPF